MPLKGLLTLAAVGLAFAAWQGANKSADADAAMFSDNQGLLTVPPASPLRSHLSIQAVGADSAARMIDLPASVEADPARVANILTPLTGRVVALKVGLGDRVKQDQILAVIASGDLAQASADEAKARDALALAVKALDRARGVREAGGNADKDLEAAQSAYNQAQAELTRAHTRLVSLNGADAHHG